MSNVINDVAAKISAYCKCIYPSDYIKLWNVKCRMNSDNTSDVIITVQLMPTDLYASALLVNAMSMWVVNSTTPAVVINDEVMRVDQTCQVQIDHPYGTDCTEAARPPTEAAAETGAVGGNNNNNNNDDDDNSTGAAVGGVIAELLIICITIVVLVVVVMLLRRREKR